MSYRHVDSNILRIPGRMDLDELAFLGALAAQIESGGQIVEVGSFYGRSTNALARANPHAKITSIDTFENVPWTQRYAKQFHGVPKFGRKAFDQFTQDLTNTHVIQGYSPDCVQNWSQPVDLYFEDAIHGNPGLARNLDFWMTRLKPGGIACGHDYNLKFPDIKSEVDARAAHWDTQPVVVGSLWAIQKPCADRANDDVIRTSLSDAPGLKITCANKRKGITIRNAGQWCGAHLDADRLHWIRLEAAEEALGIEYRLGHPKFGETGWIPAGEKAQLVSAGNARGFTRIGIRMRHSKDWHINYRLSARQIGNGGARLSGTSKWASDGDWAALPIEGPVANAITVEISPDLPRDPQSEFAKKPASMWYEFKRVLDRKILMRV